MRAAAALVLLCAAGASAQPARAPRIFISVDMEGVAGVVTDEQLGKEGFEYARFRDLMTEEANAAIAAARAAGAGEIVVADSHGSMQNLLVERLPADVQVVRGSPRPLGMMQGIDGTFGGAVFVGYHAGTTNPEGVRAHTFSSAYLADLRLNGTSVTEGAINAALAGHFGVPVLAVTGDEAAVREVASLVPGVETAAVKWAYGFHAARTLTPAAAREAIGAAVRRGMERRGQIAPHRVAAPVEMEIRFKSYRPSEVLSWLPGVRRVDAHAVRYTAGDIVEAYRFLSFVLAYQATLAP
ncbi:MAG TPA: M55 family metallopeptidase [Vicinamibacteria bacterium]|nr:M55 family metallopeptidase [Vicinamibacteria bacterium]